MWNRRGRATCVVRLLPAVLALCALAATPVRGAGPSSGPLVLPPGPAKPGFDISRFNPTAFGLFETFQVADTRPLRDALRSGVVAENTDLLVTEVGGGAVALLVEQMAYHHLAQGRTAGTDWLVTFCVVCNTATRLSPVVAGRTARFATAGVYDGMMVMQDANTGTLWNHITGEALFGPHVGTSLGPVANVLQMTVRQALAKDPASRIAISDRMYVAGGRRYGTSPGISLLGRTHGRPEQRTALSDIFAASIGAEDTRRPRMDLGLGVWTGTAARYYPRELLRLKGGALIDRFGGRQLLVYVDPDTSTPAAMFVDSARARLDKDTVRLDGNQIVRHGVLLDGRGRTVAAERPLQVFTRWYGFALTFPGTDIYGQE
jgi:hypothetical protein